MVKSSLPSKNSPPAAAAPTKKRVRRSAKASQEHILAAAEQMIIEQGPFAFTIAELARRSSVVHSNIIHHFGSVNEVQRLVAHRIAHRLTIENATLLDDYSPTSVDTLFARLSDKKLAQLYAWSLAYCHHPAIADFAALRESLHDHAIPPHPEDEGDTLRLREDLFQLTLAAAIGNGLALSYCEDSTASPTPTERLSHTMTALMAQCLDARIPK